MKDFVLVIRDHMVMADIFNFDFIWFGWYKNLSSSLYTSANEYGCPVGWLSVSYVLSPTYWINLASKGGAILFTHAQSLQGNKGEGEDMHAWVV